MNNLLEKFKNSLIVSFHSEDKDPFNSPEAAAMFAKAAVLGGAKGIRSEGIEKTKMIVENVNFPVIGFLKSKFEDGSIKITGSFKEVENILFTGCSIVAVDGTFRKREGMTGPDFISEVKKNFSCTVMADVSSYAEGLACADFGADCISSALSGNTPDTKSYPIDKPDFDIIEKLIKDVTIPVIAHGKINKPEYASAMITRGAWAVTVGTAITSPKIITTWFIEAIKANQN